MQAPVAKVVALDSNQLTLEVETSLVCARCAAGKGCGAGLLGGSARKMRRISLPASSSPGLRCGDRVRLSMQSGRLLRAALLVYGLPLSGLILALIAGSLLPGGLGETGAVVLASTGLAAGALTGWRLSKRDSCFLSLMPSIAERLPPGSNGEAAASG